MDKFRLGLAVSLFKLVVWLARPKKGDLTVLGVRLPREMNVRSGLFWLTVTGWK